MSLLKKPCESLTSHQTHEASFLVREVDGFQMTVQRDAALLDCLKHLQCGKHTKSTVKAASVGDRIEMRAQKNGRRILTAASKNSGMIPSAIDLDFKAGIAGQLEKNLSCFVMGFGEDRPMDTPVGSGSNSGQSFEIGPEALFVDPKE